jgi:hypothetical protein
VKNSVTRCWYKRLVADHPQAAITRSAHKMQKLGLDFSVIVRWSRNAAAG